MSRIGKIKLKQSKAVQLNRPNQVQLLISHPN